MIQIMMNKIIITIITITWSQYWKTIYNNNNNNNNYNNNDNNNNNNSNNDNNYNNYNNSNKNPMSQSYFKKPNLRQADIPSFPSKFLEHDIKMLLTPESPPDTPRV